MKVFKFGGASVKDAAGVRNLANVLDRYITEDLLVVVSAMGKTTNALEAVVNSWMVGEPYAEKMQALKAVHWDVLHQVAPSQDKSEHALEESFDRLDRYLSHVPSDHYNFEYDQIVSKGEVWSTIIVSAHLNQVGHQNKWLDARHIVRTDNTYREARVHWDRTSELADKAFGSLLEEEGRLCCITQGFIGHTEDKFTTTLGREGSDFSAAIFAYLLNAESVTIWKDVPGMFNADPNKYADTELLQHISYLEAIELSYFGASVIHPRTLQPLQKKGIPLFVRSFTDLEHSGSTIDERSEHDSLIPSFIIKPGQILISITPRDLSFIVEEHLSEIFGLFALRGIRIDLMQNSALAFSVCCADGPNIEPLLKSLQEEYKVRYNKGLELVTVRHYDEPTLDKLTVGKEVFIEQRSRNTARFVLR